MEKIAIYWWAFNPPTIAHQTVIQKVLTSTQINKIILTPDWHRLDKDYSISHQKRRELLEIFYKSLLKTWLNIEFCDHFLEWRNWKNTTTMQVNEFFTKKLWDSPWHIFWVDVSERMPTWEWNIKRYIETTLKKIFIPRWWYEFNSKDLENFILLEINVLMNISSTMAREMIRNKELTYGILNEEVKDFIQKNWLYQ